jgi:hypothetical protein
MQNKIHDFKIFLRNKMPIKAYLSSGKCVRKAHFSVCVWLKEPSEYKI